MSSDDTREFWLKMRAESKAAPCSISAYYLFQLEIVECFWVIFKRWILLEISEIFLID